MNAHTPSIVVTNDDGIKSPGLKAATEALVALGEIIPVAPTKQQTSMSRSLCGDLNDFLHAIEYKAASHTLAAYHSDTSPARVLLHARDVLYTGRKPDLVVSGINYGENLGTNTTVSGTIGATLQSAAMNTPSMAISLETEIENQHRHAKLNWEAAKHFTFLFARFMLTNELPCDVNILNINVPANATSDTPWKFTRQSCVEYFATRIESPKANSRIKDGKCIIDIDESRLEPDSDIYALTKERMVSVTPLSLDLTSRIELSALQKMMNKQSLRNSTNPVGLNPENSGAKNKFR